MNLNELLASHRLASNQLTGIEDATEDGLRKLATAYLKLASENGSVNLTDDVGAAAETARRLAKAQDKSAAKRTT
ncbi:low affinity iron permease family protein [Caballeronia sp. GaOx3]|uniref:low affinity iron permease family protein n=1 Tax=Caballeronia sp. GaOx3 TaxID=2921740 RepID=UPI003917C54C